MRCFAANRYEVLAGEDRIVFVDRKKTWGFGWTMVALGAVATVLAVLSGLGNDATCCLELARRTSNNLPNVRTAAIL